MARKQPASLGYTLRIHPNVRQLEHKSVRRKGEPFASEEHLTVHLHDASPEERLKTIKLTLGLAKSRLISIVLRDDGFKIKFRSD